MDILKVLSRGIKQPAKGAKQPAGAAPNLVPSAGSKANPQLFHDDASSRRGQKRKRAGQDSVPGVSDDLPDVDFFAPPSDKPETQPGASKPGQDIDRNASVPKLLDDDECRQILRAHRLKFTLLSDARSHDAKIKKSKKKSKTATPSGKEDKRQLVPQPMTSFTELRTVYRFPERVAQNLAGDSYRIPTEVQMGSLPLLLRPEIALENAPDLDVRQGVDLMAVAPTGSGKTMSFLIPAVNAILRRRAQGKVEGTHELEAIVVAPTRELAFQITNEGRKLVMGTDIKVVGMRKGMRLAAERVEEDIQSSAEETEDSDAESSEEEEEDISTSKSTVKVDILVTTPMLLLNFLSTGPSNNHRILPSVRTLILDEADVLLDPLFREQTMGIWSACTSPDLRVSFWSATMGSSIENIITERLQSRAEELGTASAPLIRLVVGLKDTAVPNITHKLVYTGTEQGKLASLRQLLHPTSGSDSGPPLRPPFLVFTQTIERAAALHEELKYDIPLVAGGPARIATLHSALSDTDRAAIMRRFRAGEIWVLTTTDVLARGVDFAGVNGVVNYDVPGSSAAYVHRAGRTGRAGREGGVAVTFYTKDDIPFVKSVANVIAASERQAGRTGEAASVQKWLLDALPRVSKQDKKRLKERGVEARRTGAAGRISSQSGWERRREQNRRAAAAGSKLRKREGRRKDGDEGGDGEWGGIGD